jgi:carbon-monoxide dehydrogenase large subunit
MVATAADISALADLASGAMQKQPDGTRAPTRNIPILCRDKVHYVGDAVAFVVAETRAQAQDAAELIEVDYDDEPAAASTATALDAKRRWSGRSSAQSRAQVSDWATPPKAEAAFAKAKNITRIRFRNNRLVCNYMEPRAALANGSPTRTGWF